MHVARYLYFVTLIPTASAEARNAAADAGRQIFAGRDVDTHGIRRSGVLAHGAKSEAISRFVQEEPQCDGDDEHEIGQKAVAEQERADAETQGLRPAVQRRDQPVGEGTIRRRSDLHGDLSDAAGQLVQAPAEEVRHAGTEDRQGKSCNVLIGPKRDREEAVDQRPQRRREEARHQGQGDGNEGDGRDPMGGAIDVLVHERGRKACDAAQVHDAGYAQVQIAALLGQDLAEGAVHDDGAEDDARVKQRGERGNERQ